MTVDRALLLPALALVLWTFVMWLWMYLTRIPAMQRARMRPDPQAPRGEQMATLPAEVRWKADNYNHLFEMPTIFYPTVIILALVSQGSTLDLGLAWAYVALRVAHSLLQALVNKIEARFALFVLSSLVLLTLAIRTTMLLVA
ncbi:MAPEG family protein [Myxococcota bacterium]|nr:MAPEG family protein [Myxococcota bacterium]